MTSNKLTRGQIAVLTCAAIPMIAFGALGGVGTYANITSVFHRSATALGVVAAGEGTTLVLALVAVGLVMLGQSVPAPVRMGLWVLPMLAAGTGAAVAQTTTEAVVFAVTPMAMTVSAEGLGLLARRIVVHRTGVDAEAQRRNAETVQRLAYHQARAANHPDKGARKRSQKAAWRLAKRVGVGDAELGANLVQVQRDRLREGADAALASMFGGSVPELPLVSPTPDAQELTATLADHFADVREVMAAPRPLVTTLPGNTPVWDTHRAADLRRQVTKSVAAESTRQMVAEPVTVTPADLRRQARRLNREAVKSTRRPVTVDTLRSELGLSRRDAAALRREIVDGVSA
ncbi:conjugal transfer protein [Streptomyces sp. NPDC046977]|uniref:conjugal transfer protein n=1 Tax=Streptomyces sp. NPDC046977 TaxID=3154703 RepID=UPI0033E3EA48